MKGFRWRLISLCYEREAFVQGFVTEISHCWFDSSTLLGWSYIVCIFLDSSKRYFAKICASAAECCCSTMYIDKLLSSLVPSVFRCWNYSLPHVQRTLSGIVWKLASIPRMSTSLTTAKSCTTDSFSRRWNLWVNICDIVCLFDYKCV